jgi:probable phosphoglycerate mutase
MLVGYEFSLVLTSPLQRARRTAELAGLDAEVDPFLVEWDYGGYEGRTTREIRSELGYNWSAFTHGVIRGLTPGETVEEVAARASRVLTRVLPAMANGDVALVAHGHFLRILTAVYLRMAPRFGAQITLDAGSVGAELLPRAAGHHVLELRTRAALGAIRVLSPAREIATGERVDASEGSSGANYRIFA